MLIWTWLPVGVNWGCRIMAIKESRSLRRSVSILNLLWRIWRLITWLSNHCNLFYYTINGARYVVPRCRLSCACLRPMYNELDALRDWHRRQMPRFDRKSLANNKIPGWRYNKLHHFTCVFARWTAVSRRYRPKNQWVDKPLLCDGTFHSWTRTTYCRIRL